MVSDARPNGEPTMELWVAHPIEHSTKNQRSLKVSFCQRPSVAIAMPNAAPADAMPFQVRNVSTAIIGTVDQNRIVVVRVRFRGSDAVACTSVMTHMAAP